MVFSRFMLENINRIMASKLADAGILASTTKNLKTTFSVEMSKRGGFSVGISLAGINANNKEARKIASDVIDKELDGIFPAIMGENYDTLWDHIAKGFQGKGTSDRFEDYLVESRIIASRRFDRLNKTTLQGRDGKFIARQKALSLMGLAMYHHLKTYMQSPGAALRWRTGRFATSAFISGFQLTGNNLEIPYGYLKWPYQVFDPDVSTYRGLSSKGRDPKRLITEAIQKAAKEVLHARYRVLPRLI